MKPTSAPVVRIAKPFRLVADLWITHPQLLQGKGWSEKSAYAVRFLTLPSAPVRLVTCGFPIGVWGDPQLVVEGLPSCPLRVRARARMTEGDHRPVPRKCHPQKKHARARVLPITRRAP